MATNRKQRDELLVYGYVRTVRNLKRNHCEIPKDITNICFRFYYVDAFFEKAGSKIKISEDEQIISCVGFGSNSAYGNVIMPSISDQHIEYEYELKVLKEAQRSINISIGIDDAGFHNLNNDFSGQDLVENYGYYATYGSIYSKGTAGCGQTYGEKFGTGDVIKMVYDPFKSTLRFYKNGTDQGLIENIASNKELSYRLCVCLGYGTVGSVQLL